MGKNFPLREASLQIFRPFSKYVHVKRLAEVWKMAEKSLKEYSGVDNFYTISHIFHFPHIYVGIRTQTLVDSTIEFFPRYIQIQM